MIDTVSRIPSKTDSGISHMKGMTIDIEAERFNDWLEENYPDIVPESEAWEQAANLYYWVQEALADQAQWDHEHGLFVVSLNDVHQRHRHARQELQKLHALLDREQPELVYRMSFVHAVTVMEAYLMYCARALLEHDWPLKRFRDEYYLKPERIKKNKSSMCVRWNLICSGPSLAIMFPE